MRKKVFTVLLAMGATLLLGACGSEEEVKKVNVTFKQDGQQDIVKTIEAGDFIIDLPSPTDKPGYTVTWDIEEFTHIYDDMTVYAVETANTYTITYNANGGDIDTSTQEVTFDAQTTLKTPTREDYAFLGWYWGETKVENGQWTIASDVTLTAAWEDVRTYTVTFVDGEFHKEIEVKRGDSVVDSDVPEFVGKTGYTAAWDKAYTNIQENTTITAVYTPKTYTITYQAEGYSMDGTTALLTFDAPCTALDMSLTKEGYDFLGWKYGEMTYTNQTVWNIADNVTLTADWLEKGQLLIMFVDTNGVQRKTVYAGDTLTEIPTPTEKAGYDVSTDWYIDETCKEVASFENITQNMTVYAKATPKTYTITYKAEGFDIDGRTVNLTYDAYCWPLEMSLTKVGYDFIGWQYGDATYVDSSKWDIADNVEITPVWKEKEQFTITFVNIDGTTITKTVYKGETLTDIPTLPMSDKVGYEYAWDAESFSNIQQSFTTTAQETPKTYTITFDLKGGYLSQTTLKVRYGEDYVLPTPLHAKSDFLYWTYNGAKFAESGKWTIDGDIVLVAVWDSYTNDY